MPVMERTQRPEVTPEQKKFAREVGGRVRARRVAAKLDRDELAERSGVLPSLIRNTEQGVSRLTLDNASKIAKGLKCKVDDLLHGPVMQTPEAGRPSKSDDDDE